MTAATILAGEYQRDRAGGPEICNSCHPPGPRPLPRHHQVNWGRETFLQDSAFPRYNVDPFDAHTDEEVWRAIERANLKKKVLEIIFHNYLGLWGDPSSILEAGKHFSERFF